MISRGRGNRAAIFVAYPRAEVVRPRRQGGRGLNLWEECAVGSKVYYWRQSGRWLDVATDDVRQDALISIDNFVGRVVCEDHLSGATTHNAAKLRVRE